MDLFAQMFTDYIAYIKTHEAIINEMRDSSFEFSILSIFEDCKNDLISDLQDDQDSFYINKELHEDDYNKYILKISRLLMHSIYEDEYFGLHQFLEIMHDCWVFFDMFLNEIKKIPELKDLEFLLQDFNFDSNESWEKFHIPEIVESLIY